MEPIPGQETNELYETVEAFTLHLSQDKGLVLLSHIVLVPVPVSVPVLLNVNVPLKSGATSLPNSEATCLLVDRYDPPISLKLDSIHHPHLTL